MKHLEELKDKLCKELDEYSQKQRMTGSDLEIVHKLTDTIKNIGKIEMLEGEKGGYSEAGGVRDWDNMPSYGEGDYAEARGRRGNVRRDRMGRYSRDGGYAEDGGSSYDRGGYRGGYSRGDAKEHMLEQIEEMMEKAESPKERDALHRCMMSLKNA